MIADAPPIVTPVACDYASLTRRLAKVLPNTPVSEVRVSDMPGYALAVFENGNAGYVSCSGKYVIIGIVIDLDKMRVLDDLDEGVSSGL